MKTSSNFWHAISRLLISLPVLLLMAACSGQRTVQPNGIPVTGLATASPALAAQSNPAAAQESSTPAQIAQFTPTQPAAAGLSCSSLAALTPAVTEGPFFKAGSPERSNLVEAGMAGTQLTLTGTVLTADCKPVAHALLDFWQANSQGQYDNSGYTLRGHEFTDQNGSYQLETIVPGLYPGRTEHIHVKVQPPGGPLLTTQLFFPGVVDNSSDSIYDPALLIKLQGSGSHLTAAYDFVISAK
jgi:protocatechuate 3,4-dioxygenase beta subunit